MASIDSYLDELLAPDMPPPRAALATEGAPAADGDTVMPASAGDAFASTRDAAADAAPDTAADATGTNGPDGGISAFANVDPDLLAELMADPALTGAMPTAVAPSALASAAPVGQSEAVAVDPDLLAELMADPALTGAMPAAAAAPAPAVAAVPMHAVAADEVAAAARAAAPVAKAPPARTSAPAPSIEPAPASMRAPAVPDLSAFMPPTASPIAPVARAAVAAASASHTRTATGGHRWLRVCVGHDSYAFELLRVQEVVRVAPVVAMRGAAHSVLGVMNLRGRIVPVFDLGLWLDVGAVHSDERARIVVIERNDELIGVLVTAVDDVVSLEREHVEPPLPGADPGPTLGVARVTAAPTVLLDADALFD